MHRFFMGGEGGYPRYLGAGSRPKPSRVGSWVQRPGRGCLQAHEQGASEPRPAPVMAGGTH